LRRPLGLAAQALIMVEECLLLALPSAMNSSSRCGVPSAPGVQLAGLDPSPVVALNRAIELAGNTAETAYLTRRDQLG